MTVRLPIARFGRLGPGWFIEGDGWTMQPQGNVSISEAKRICNVTAAALRADVDGGGMGRPFPAAEPEDAAS